MKFIKTIFACFLFTTICQAQTFKFEAGHIIMSNGDKLTGSIEIDRSRKHIIKDKISFKNQNQELNYFTAQEISEIVIDGDVKHYITIQNNGKIILTEYVLKGELSLVRYKTENTDLQLFILDNFGKTTLLKNPAGETINSKKTAYKQTLSSLTNNCGSIKNTIINAGYSAKGVSKVIEKYHSNCLEKTYQSFDIKELNIVAIEGTIFSSKINTGGSSRLFKNAENEIGFGFGFSYTYVPNIDYGKFLVKTGLGIELESTQASEEVLYQTRTVLSRGKFTKLSLPLILGYRLNNSSKKSITYLGAGAVAQYIINDGDKAFEFYDEIGTFPAFVADSSAPFEFQGSAPTFLLYGAVEAGSYFKLANAYFNVSLGVRFGKYSTNQGPIVDTSLTTIYLSGSYQIF